MALQETLNEKGIESRRIDYGNRTEYVLDFGPGADVSLDIIDDTMILVVGDEQYDIGLEGNAQVFNNNGVVTIEVDT